MRTFLHQSGGLGLLSAWLCLGLLWSGAARAETLTLADCLREVAEHNPTIIQQRAAVEGSNAARLTLRARALPSLTLGGLAGVLNQQQDVAPVRVPKVGGGSRTVPGSVRTNEQLIAIGTEALFQPLFDAAIPASFRRGTVGVIVAEQNSYNVAATQLHAARLLFYQALYQQQSGDLLRQSDESLAGNVKAQEQLVGAGLAGRASLLSAQVQRTNFNPGIIAAGGTYRTSLGSLLQAMGRELPFDKPGDDPLKRVTLSGALDEASVRFDAATATRLALARRPDLRSLRAMVKLEQEDANIAKAGDYPLIRLYVQGELVPNNNVRNSPNAIRQSDQVQTTEFRPGITGNWMVIDTGATRGAVRAQEAQRDSVAIGLQQLERSLPAQLAAVHARLDEATARLNALQGNVPVAQDTLNIIQGGVAQGINSQTEFLFAQTELLNVRTGLLAAKLELTLAHAEFDLLTGNYLRYVEEPPEPSIHRTANK